MKRSVPLMMSVSTTRPQLVTRSERGWRRRWQPYAQTNSLRPCAASACNRSSSAAATASSIRYKYTSRPRARAAVDRPTAVSRLGWDGPVDTISPNFVLPRPVTEPGYHERSGDEQASLPRSQRVDPGAPGGRAGDAPVLRRALRQPV